MYIYILGIPPSLIVLYNNTQCFYVWYPSLEWANDWS